MKLLFIQGGSRVRECESGNSYVDGNFDNNVWKRYKSYCSELNVVLRKCSGKFKETEIKKQFNAIDKTMVNLKTVDDIYSPKTNFLDFKRRKIIKNTIEKEVKEADAVIIRSVGNFYTNVALHYCKKYKKKYLIEVTGFAFEGLWYHSILGKLVAIPREIYLKKSIKRAPYAVYVTEKALQKRYPCYGKTLGCSDVELEPNNEEILNARLKKIAEHNNETIYKIGTAAFLDVKWKGQRNVVKAIAKLKHNGIANVKYQLIGYGSGKNILKLAKKLNVEQNIEIIGTLPHQEVFKWFDLIDCYIQPSYQEGLCRALIEAMSRACPVICSDVGGNFELINENMRYKVNNINKLADCIQKMMKIEKEEAIKNFNYSRRYEKELLDKKRDFFYNAFVGDKNNE